MTEFPNIFRKSLGYRCYVVTAPPKQNRNIVQFYLPALGTALKTKWKCILVAGPEGFGALERQEMGSSSHYSFQCQPYFLGELKAKNLNYCRCRSVT